MQEFRRKDGHKHLGRRDGEGRQQFQFLQDQADHHVSHRKSDCRERFASHVAQQVVVSSTAQDGTADAAGNIECFEDGAGVIQQAAHDVRIELDVLSHTQRFQRFEQPDQFLGFSPALTVVQDGFQSIQLPWCQTDLQGVGFPGFRLPFFPGGPPARKLLLSFPAKSQRCRTRRP